MKIPCVDIIKNRANDFFLNKNMLNVFKRAIVNGSMRERERERERGEREREFTYSYFLIIKTNEPSVFIYVAFHIYIKC